ncbi:MAG: ABC transporter ATP-binding protein [Lachnospiraceae bacterium]|nr:ABC transporter ATP-binding protein [Lachnospiraceae bacterium]
MKKLVNFVDVIKDFGTFPNVQRVVDGVNFSIYEGEFVVILGASGAGKSTVLNMLGGMEKPSYGDIYVDDINICELNDNKLAEYRAEKIGYIFQSYNLIPSLNVYENVNISKEIVKGGFNTDDVIELVGLKNHKHKFPSQLSGGQQQRVAIARVLSKNPDIILGDEPTGALDTDTGIMVMALLQQLCWQLGKTIVIVTHNPEYVNYADRVIYMKNGMIEKHMLNDNPMQVQAENIISPLPI